MQKAISIGVINREEKIDYIITASYISTLFRHLYQGNQNDASFLVIRWCSECERRTQWNCQLRLSGPSRPSLSRVASADKTSTLPALSFWCESIVPSSAVFFRMFVVFIEASMTQHTCSNSCTKTINITSKKAKQETHFFCTFAPNCRMDAKMRFSAHEYSTL